MNPSTAFHRTHLFASLTCLGLMLLLFACVIPGLQRNSPSTSISTPFNSSNVLPDPANGLAQLQRYQAVYDETLQGSIDGKPFDRQSHLEYSFVTQSNDEEILWEEQQEGDTQVYQHTLRLGKASYTLSQDGQSCWGAYQDTPVETIPSPASLLLPVTQARKVGAETVNGVATTHFHIDQKGISAGTEGASGEVWLAQTGGYVVKYTLTIPAPAQPTGQGVEVAETLTYEMKGINSTDPIELPEVCMPVLTDLPVMSDAQNLYRGSGILQYTSQAKMEEAVNFYRQALPPMGWTEVVTAIKPASTNPLSLEFMQGNQHLTVFLDPSESSLDVVVMRTNAAPAPQETTEVPSTPTASGPKPTADASQSGLPADVPLYPGATDLTKLPNVGVSFSTTDSPEVVATFYRTQLKTLKWDLQSEMKPDAKTIIQTWSKSGRMVVVTITVNSDGSTMVMLALANQ